MQKLLNAGNHKTIKGEKFGWKTFGLHLAPYKLAGINVCPHATVGCSTASLNTAGRGAFSNVQRARSRKTLFWLQHHEAFMCLLMRDIRKLRRKAKRDNMTLAIRLNGTSDNQWEKQYFGYPKTTLIEKFPTVQFYDYTKIPLRNEPDN